MNKPPTNKPSGKDQQPDQDQGQPNWKAQLKGDKKKASRYFASEPDNPFVKRLTLKKTDGRTVSILYSYIPVIDFIPGKYLRIKAHDHDLTITIIGRGLHIIEEGLRKEKITWIQESDTGMDDKEEDLFVKTIGMSGELLEHDQTL